MTAFSALPGTMLIALDPDEAPLPIFGWFHNTGLSLTPLVIGHPGPMVAGEAIELTDGRVFDPATGDLFSDADSWRDDHDTNPRYSPGMAIKTHSAILVVSNPVAQNAAASASPVITPIAGGKFALDFSGKAYTKASFWRAGDFVFALDGGNATPLGAKKITREQMVSLRTSGEAQEVSWQSLMPVSNKVEPEPEDEEEDDDLI